MQRIRVYFYHIAMLVCGDFPLEGALLVGP